MLHQTHNVPKLSAQAFLSFLGNPEQAIAHPHLYCPSGRPPPNCSETDYLEGTQCHNFGQLASSNMMEQNGMEISLNLHRKRAKTQKNIKLLSLQSWLTSSSLS